MTEVQSTYHLDEPTTDIYVGDCREILPSLQKESVELIFADPPFNQGVNYNTWNDNMSQVEYIQFTHNWIDECLRVLAPNGSIWINVPDGISAEIVMHLKSRGLYMVNWCIWHYRFGQCCNSKFIGSKTHVLYFTKETENRIWNPDQILEASDRASIYNDGRTKKTQTPGQRVPLDVWYGPNWGRIQGNNKERRTNHENQIPEVYMERIIRACSNEGDMVLDPFLGSGTTCTVARVLNRRSIGIEYSEVYAKSAFDRIQKGPVRVDIEALIQTHKTEVK
jgi:DNA modification methylase